MIDDTIELYKRALILKAQEEELQKKQKALISDAVTIDLVKGDSPSWNLIDFVAHFKSLLEKELPSLVQAKEYGKIEIIASLFTDSSRPKEEAKRKAKEPESSETQEQTFNTALPDSLYKESKNFGDLMNKARKYRNDQGNGKLTWTRLAEFTGISLTYINNIRTGSIPSEAVISRLAAVLGGDKNKFLKIAKG